jgi:hypothetical protein
MMDFRAKKGSAREKGVRNRSFRAFTRSALARKRGQEAFFSGIRPFGFEINGP